MIRVRDDSADRRYNHSMSRRQQFAELIPQIVSGRDSVSIAELYEAVELGHADLVDDEIEPVTGAIRWKHEFRWELETLVVNGLVRRRKDLGRGVYSTV